jgi:hypothetical protein
MHNQYYINSRGLSNKKLVHAVSLTPYSRKAAIKKSNFFANTKQNSKKAHELGSGGLFDEKKTKGENIVALSL